ILAGTVSRTEQLTLQGLPGIAKLPILGAATSLHNKQTDDAELIVTIRPHLVREAVHDAEAGTAFVPAPAPGASATFLAFSCASKSIICFRISIGVSLTFSILRPFRKRVGVALTPNAAPSWYCWFTRTFVSAESAQVAVAAASAPESVAMPFSLSTAF